MIILSLGVLHGRYYDNKGQETAYSKELSQRIEKCVQEKKRLRLDEIKHPPCNVEWNADEGTKVWCTRTRFVYCGVFAASYSYPILDFLSMERLPGRD